MPSRSVRACRGACALVAALGLVALGAGRGAAQEPGLEVFYKKLAPRAVFKYTWKGQPGVASAGVFHWEVPETEFGTNGFDRNFTGYCAEVLVPIESGKLYRFKMGSLAAPSHYGAQDHPNADRVGAARAALVRELFGRFYRGTDGADETEAVAFQIALWELAQEPEPADGPAAFDLFGGEFRADYPRDSAPAFVTKAQEYLSALTGDDSSFYSNPNTKGRELVRLQGVPNADGVTGQSQFALRFAGGGGTGGGTLPPLAGTDVPLGGGGTGTGTGGPGVPGAGGNLLDPNGGGPGGLLVPGNGGSSVPPSNNPPVRTPPGGGGGSTPPGGGGGGSNPPGGGGGVPPVGGPNNPSGPNPVPAPAGLILGAIALGTIGSWRWGTRVRRAK